MKFKALRIAEISPTRFQSKIEICDIDQLPQNEVLIKVFYSALNYKDALSANGNRGVTKTYPHTPGIDAAGIVVYANVPHLKINQEVLVTGYDLGMNTWGGLSEYISVPASWVVPKPKTLSLKESMALGTAGFSAALAIHKLLRNNQQPQQGPIIVTGATGGVGLCAISILKKLGFEVIAITSKPEKFDFLKQIGADQCLLLNEIPVSKKPLHKPIWAGAIDNIGGIYLESIIKSTCKEGNIISIGMASSTSLNLSVFPFILNGVNLLGINSADCIKKLRLEIWDKLETLWRPQNLAIFTNEIMLSEAPEKLYQMLVQKSWGRTVVRLSHELV